MMKRGFLDWNQREISPDDLATRRGRVLARMKADGLVYALVYGDVSHCDDVHYLTQFNTYTRDCVLLLSSDGKMSLVSSLTLRDREWIAGVTPIDGKDIYFSAGLVKTSEVLKKAGFSGGKVGLVGEYFPRVLLDHLQQELPNTVFADLSRWYRELRGVKDPAEVRLIKRAALLAAEGAHEFETAAVFGAKDTGLSAQAEWRVRSRGGEDYYFLCSSGGQGYLDLTRNVDVQGRFAYSLLTQYKGCWASLARTVWERESGNEARAYRALEDAVQAAEGPGGLSTCILEARKAGWSVEIKAPVGTDADSALAPALKEVPDTKGAVFSLRFTKSASEGVAVYGETIHVSEEGYELLTR